MSVSISELGNLNPIEPLDLNTYPEARAFELPKAGVYDLQAPESFPREAFSATKANDLLVAVPSKILGPTNEGFELRFLRISSKQYPRRDGKIDSKVGEYLRSCGFKGLITDQQAQVDAIESTANLQYKALLDWEARNNSTGYTLRGMTNFPSNGNGGYQSWVADPTEKDENGQPKRLRANLVVTRFLAKKDSE